MDKIFDNFFRKFSYKFDKGYPDLNNEQDTLMLELLISTLIEEPFLIYEVNLSPTQLIKPYHSGHEFYGQYKDRGERFLEKINNGETFELINGKSIIVDKEKSNEGIDLLKNKSYAKLAGVKKYFYDKEGNAYSLSNFEKTEEFGSGTGMGAGSAQTDVQESSQCLVNALSYKLKKGNLTSEDLTTPNFIKVKQWAITSTPFEEMVKFITSATGWTNTFVATANTLYKNYSNPNLTFHRGSDFVKKIEAAFAVAKKKKGLTLNKDKWNPADIWMVDKSILEIEFKTELEDLNQQLLELYNENKLIGTSLKKIGKEANIHVYNDVPVKHEFTYEGYKTTNKSKSADILFNEGRITFRSFNFADNFAGEIQGKTAAHGKLGISIINNFIKDKGTIPSTKDIRKKIYDGEESFFKELYQLYNKYVESISEEKFKEQFDSQNEDWKFSKYLSLSVVNIIEGLSKDEQDNLVNNIISYAKSSSNLSSVFIKVS